MRAIPGRLLFLAALLESLYLVLLALGDLRRFLPETILALLLSGILYLVCIYLISQNESSGKPAGGWRLGRFVVFAAIIFRLTLWPLYPALSDDVYRYRWEGRLQAAGGNPYQVRPNDTGWERLRDNTFQSIPGRDFMAVYGPLIEVIQFGTYSAVAVLTSDPVRQAFWFKLPAALFDIGILCGLWRLLKARRLAGERILIYAWCPLPAIEFWGTGHNDAIALFFVVLAFLGATRERWTAAFAMLTLGAAAKLWPILLFPAFIGWRGWRPLRWYQWTVALPVMAALALPYWSSVSENIRFTSGFVGGWRNNDSLFGALLWLTGDIYQAKYLATGLICAVALAVMWLRMPLERAWIVLVAAILTISANSHPWYLSWMLPALAIVPFTPFLLWTVLAPVAYHVVIDWAALGVWRGSTPMRWLIYVPVYAWLVVKAASVLFRKNAPAGQPGRGKLLWGK